MVFHGVAEIKVFGLHNGQIYSYYTGTEHVENNNNSCNLGYHIQ